jgi:hypothetical protein
MGQQHPEQRGSGISPSVSARSETVSHKPTATMIRELRINGQLAWLSMNGILGHLLQLNRETRQ